MDGLKLKDKMTVARNAVANGRYFFGSRKMKTRIIGEVAVATGWSKEYTQKKLKFLADPSKGVSVKSSNKSKTFIVPSSTGPKVLKTNNGRARAARLVVAPDRRGRPVNTPKN